MTEQEHKAVAATAASFARSDERSRCLAVVAKYLGTKLDKDKPLPEAERLLLLELAGADELTPFSVEAIDNGE